VTEQYLCGELAIRLATLANAAAADDQLVTALRRHAESAPPSALPAIVRRALQIADHVCWDALHRGDIARFTCAAAAAADLHEFAVCARLLG
jgi:hypothetical protein